MDKMNSNHPTHTGINQPKTKLGLLKMNKLADSAEKLFTEQGFYQTSISDICKNANTAVGTFYIYFETKTDIYRFIMEKYERTIKARLADAIKDCKTRYEMERAGFKAFIKYAVACPSAYNILWGSLSVDKSLFINYYESFARSYTKALKRAPGEVADIDPTSVAYMLMGMSNFLGLRAIFENMSDSDIDRMIDDSLMPALSSGMLIQK